MSKFLRAAAIAATLVTAPAHAEKLGLGRPALPEEVAAWDHDVRPDGLGLPEGSGDALTGEELFSENCATCHGEFGEGVGRWPVLAGGFNTLNRADPVKTVGSYWPYVSTVWDYVHRSMPFGNAQTLSNDDVYAIVAYILYSNDLIEDDFVLSKDTIGEVEMPNADGFIADDRDAVELAAFTREPCMENCKDSVEITAHATVLDVTPEDSGDPATAGDAPTDAAAGETATDEASAEVMAGADPALIEEGEKVFRKCKACHKIGEGAKNGTGPLLNGIVGRTAASVEGFRYSKPMIAAAEGGLAWTDETLAEFLANPKGYMKGTKMSFAGLKKTEEIAAVIAYLASAGG